MIRVEVPVSLGGGLGVEECSGTSRNRHQAEGNNYVRGPRLRHSSQVYSHASRRKVTA